MHRNSLTILAASVAGLLTTVPALMAASFYTPVSVTSSTAGSDLFPVINMIQGPGVGYDAAEPHNQLGPTGDSATRWVTAAPGGFPSDYIAIAGPVTLTFDLGADRSLSEVSYWGYTTSNANGVSSFNLSFATTADGLAGFGTSVTYNPTFNPVIDDLARQSFPFSQGVTARYVQMVATDNFYSGGGFGPPPGGDRVGAGELAFAIPEPAMPLLGGIAGLALCCRRSKRSDGDVLR